MLHPERAHDRRETPEHIPPGARSPHPYRRQSLDIPDRLFVTNLAARNRHPHIAQEDPTVPRSQRNDSDIGIGSPRERRSQRILTTSPSDSGTEADDEKPYLRGLPLAKSKSRKGLKDTSGAVTPSDFDGITEAFFADRHSPAPEASSTTEKLKSTATDEQVSKYIRRWRSELFRRFSEVNFVFGLTYFALKGAAEIHVHQRLDEEGDWDDLALQHATWLCWLVYGSLIAHMMWLLSSHLIAARGSSRAKLRHAPSPYDPAPLLYTFFLPVAIAASVTSTWQSRSIVIQVNVLLGIVSWLQPHASWISSGHSAPQMAWLITAVLVAWSSYHYNQGQDSATHPLDGLMFLGPLMWTLSRTLQYFCGSSLLRAETQLLSTGLINLLFFAATPQSSILFALMWIGGIAMLLLCRHVMKWSTMLARIPGWRFRSPRHANAPAATNSEPSALTAILNASTFLPDRLRQDSSDDMEWSPDKSRITIRRDNVPVVQKQPRPNEPERNRHNATVIRPVLHQSIERRHTFPLADGLSTAKEASGRGPSKRKQKKRKFLWLTRTQASVVAVLFALYCYAVAVGVILVPVRSYIQEKAFAGTEPVGWALGYLLGDLPAFRLQVVLSQLDLWIALPPRLDILGTVNRYSCDYHRFYTIGAANTRLVIALWCIVNLMAGIGTVLRLRTVVEVDTRRKVFHGMMVSMFLPSILIDPCFVALAFSLVLAIFLLLDVFRAAQLPPISRPLTNFLAPYVDGRDHKGPIIVSPIFLLIGCAIPLWLSLASFDRGSSITIETSHPWYRWELRSRDLSMVAGVICVGMGDAAASLIGRRYGRRRWIWSGGKSLEGSAAFVLAVVAGLALAETFRRLGGWPRDQALTMSESLIMFLGKALIAGIGASFTEAVLTGGNDNVIVPVVLWLLVRSLRI